MLDLHFINVNTATPQERTRNVHLARAHAAKINRRKKSQLGNQPSSFPRPTALLPIRGAGSASTLWQKASQQSHISSAERISSALAEQEDMTNPVFENAAT